MAARTRHHWTEDEIEIIRRDYQQTKASQAELAGRFGVSQPAMASVIRSAGLSKRGRLHRPWMADEDERLRDLVGRFCVRRIALMLHRSRNAVSVRIKRLRLSLRLRDGWYIEREVAAILGVDSSMVKHWIRAGALRATPHHDEVPAKAGGRSWHIEAKDLRRFLRRYPDELNGRNVDMIQVVDLLTGLDAPDYSRR